MSGPFRETGRTPLSDASSVARFRHRSGLTVVLCPDAASPLCAVQLWYRIGSANETNGQTGIAHLFEHLMFNGTTNVATGEFDRLIEMAGGDCNAATWVDWTSYSITVPRTELELALRLESDRMVNLQLDSEVLEAEREVVLNERLERVEDDIGGYLDERLGALAFEVHPYGRPTIGFEQDIRNLDLKTITRFYRSNYAPNNAVLVITGGVAESDALDAVDHYFGAIAPGTGIVRSLAAEPAQTAERRASFSRPTRSSRLIYGYKIPGQTHSDWAPLAALAGLLSGGPSARLTRSLVADAELASYADCEVLPFSDPTLFRVAVAGTRGTSVEKLGVALDDQLDALGSKEPISELEMEKVKSSLETDFWIELETDEGKAESFGHYETAHGDYQQLFSIAERLRAVTAEDLARVSSTYLRRELRSVVSVAAEDSEKQASA